MTFTFDELGREHARSRPARLAVVDGPVRLTYAELDDRVGRVAAALAVRNVGAGERVVWLGQNSFRVLELLLAAARLGAIFCAANWRSSADELRFVLDDLTPTAVVWQEEEIGTTVRAALDAAPKASLLRHDAGADDPDGYEAAVAAATPHERRDEVDPDQPLLAMYTAAFEGRPHAALLSHTALLVQDLVVGRMQDITDESVFLNSGPLFHVATFMSTNATFHHGGTNVFIRRADPDEMARTIEAERCTHAVIMGPTLDALIARQREAGYDLTSLWPTGDPADNRSTIVTPDSAPWRARPGGYGQTEVVGLATFLGPGSKPEGRAGRPSPATAVRLVDPSGRDVPDGEVGEIVVRGLTVFSGYWNRPELNAARSAGGWHHTRDLGRREPDGSLTFVGPNTTMIKSAAENIYPAEVEACLASHPAVQEVCVIGVPDPEWTQRVKAVVVRREGASVTAEELTEHCRSRIASYKKPSLVDFTDRLPRLASGMVDRAAVDAAFGGGGYPGAGYSVSCTPRASGSG
jgi:acyl-CoA synthetase (AMP-forming)/AMP-acid ligase II